MFGETLFFQIAAGLIPALLFGGLVSQTFTPNAILGKGTERKAKLPLAVFAILVVVFGLLAELIAIDVAISPADASSWKIVLVVNAVVISTALIGLALIWPWLTALSDALRLRWLPILVLPVLTVFLVVGTGTLSTSVVESIGESERTRIACYARETEKNLLADSREAYALLNALSADSEKLVGFSEERVRVESMANLTRSQRAALFASIDAQEKLVLDRITATNKQLEESFTRRRPTELLPNPETIDDLLQTVGC